MRTAYKVWSGIAAGVFCLVAAVDLSSSHPAPAPTVSSAASPVAAPVLSAVPAPDPAEGTVYDTSAGVTKTVSRLDSYRDVEFTDGSVAHVDGEDLTTEPYAGCQEKVLTAAAHRLLDGKTVTVGHDSSRTYTERQDWVRLRGYEQYQAETDYTTALTSETSSQVVDQCYPETPTTTSSPSSSGGDVDVDVDHHNHRDGALTGGYCARKWWC